MDIGILVLEHIKAVAEDRRSPPDPKHLIGFRIDRRVGGLSVSRALVASLSSMLPVGPMRRIFRVE
jgi:hypothetical protein